MKYSGCIDVKVEKMVYKLPTLTRVYLDFAPVGGFHVEISLHILLA
jgi:hypothetical protein